MATIHNIPEQTYQPGHYDVGPLNLQNNEEFINVRLTRVNWPDTGSEIVKCMVDLSMDNGQTWILDWFGFGAMGGTVQNPDGSVVTETLIHREIPPGTNRRIRLSVDVFSAFTTAVNVDNN